MDYPLKGPVMRKVYPCHYVFMVWYIWTCCKNPTMYQSPIMCAHFCSKMVNCEIFASCIVGYVKWVSFFFIGSDVTIGYGGGTHAQNPCKQDMVVGEDASGQLLTPAEKQLTDVYGFTWPYDHEEIFDFLYALHLRRYVTRSYKFPGINYWVPFYIPGLTVIPGWISNYINSEM